MKNILVFGAGRSSWFTIDYLFSKQKEGKLMLTVADASAEAIEACRKDFPNANLLVADVHNEEERRRLVVDNDIIISLLPARFHNLVAEDCLSFKKHLITPSYISPEIQAMDEMVKQNNLIFLNELGLDPGIDHLSAMQIIHRLKQEGAEILSFKSYTGGLIAAESDTNPWHYKISWNPYNIIRAGQDGGICLENGNKKYLSYNRLFGESELLDTKTSGKFDAYLNRNSLTYIDLYGLHEAGTFIRGTLRYPGFCALWQFLVNAGITNDKIIIEDLAGLPWKDFYRIFMPLPNEGIESNFKIIMGRLPEAAEVKAIEWINFYSDEKMSMTKGTSAEVLQSLLEEKWKMASEDRDRVVMVHEFIYRSEGIKYKLQSVLDITGEDSHRTAMARTVGLPLALAAELIALDKIHANGVLLPIIPEIFEPLLKALEDSGIRFSENVEVIE